MPGVLNGTIEPGRVFDRAISLAEVPELALQATRSGF
jgi:hypothetical protein